MVRDSMARGWIALFVLAALTNVSAQWQLQESHSSANLRGIHSVDGRIAWASGAEGTVLRTEDSGTHWQKCITPEGADKLDFRGIWAWDARRALVMSSGPGDQSRIYRTTDGCAHWAEESRNTEKDGFWDALTFHTGDFGTGAEETGVLIGDPVGGRFYTEVTTARRGWVIDNSACAARPDEAAFAASNSSVFVFGSRRYALGTGGKGGPHILISPLLAHPKNIRGEDTHRKNPGKDCMEVAVPLAGGSESAGVFSLAFRSFGTGIAVGGDYKHPEATYGTAAWTADGGKHWTAAVKPPHGYRSSVAWYAAANAWIAAGTNGSDVSYDDGKTWRTLDNGNWNAVSLPYVVGPSGRIAKLQADSLKR